MSEHPLSTADSLTQKAEKSASEAERLPTFSGFQLTHAKKSISVLLSHIGREGIFNQFTRHDISHINQMLAMLDWLIPKTTAQTMSTADWLMTVLAIYLHDLGMLVTQYEYDQRNTSEFPEFKDSVLSAEAFGADYKEKIVQLGPDVSERFLYQEFVRRNHAKRIRAWIMGQAPAHLGASQAAANELSDLLKRLPTLFRRDLSLICESHHLEDLGDLSKYKVSQPYGTTKEETANLQYAAILTRTTDLLHITSDRTPSVEFRLINPTNPISQEEWAKQAAVNTIRPQLGKDKDGNPSDDAIQDTIEVHAFFTQPSGFFGLTSYLAYAKQQIQKSYEWARRAKELAASKYSFPWRYIDDTHIETEGFLPKPFEFQLDQAKVLDLLTGHTLYNDTTVVVRELVQNSVDAVRLQRLIEKSRNGRHFEGSINIEFDTKNRTLLVQDNGTGMTQEIIEKHLLRAGSSRYQDTDFQRQHPNFSPISRFGIGILSSFMVADAVEVFTCSPEEEKGRQLSLRSVHGKYLIRLLDKNSPEIESISPHGTRIRLHLRASANLEDVLAIARHWIVIPDCNVQARIDNSGPIRIGFDDTSAALEDCIKTLGYEVDKGSGPPADGAIRVREETSDGLALAYAVRWSESFREWSFFSPPMADNNEEKVAFGTCIEGIRIDQYTPGFANQHLLAIANATGMSAPKTNVARSAFEASPEFDSALAAIYRTYCKHVQSETNELQTIRSFSPSWAAEEAHFLLLPMVSNLQAATSSKLLLEEIKRLPLLLLEENTHRKPTTPVQLAEKPFFWTVNSAFFSSAEHLIREANGSASLTDLVKTLEDKTSSTLPEPLLCAFSPRNEIIRLAIAGREVDQISINRPQRRIDLRWAPASSPSRWIAFPEELIPRQRRMWTRNSITSILSIYVAEKSVPMVGLASELGVRSNGYTYLKNGTPIATHLIETLRRLQTERSPKSIAAALAALRMVVVLLRIAPREPLSIDQLRRHVITSPITEFTEDLSEEALNLTALLDLANATTWRVFDTEAWTRSSKLALDEDEYF